MTLTTQCASVRYLIPTEKNGGINTFRHFLEGSWSIYDTIKEVAWAETLSGDRITKGGNYVYKKNVWNVLFITDLDSSIELHLQREVKSETKENWHRTYDQYVRIQKKNLAAVHVVR